MSSSDSHDDPPAESGPAFSREAVTPRGGFMARPGLKPPPTHAVVVRGGDAPLSEHIPVARSSFPPPPPPSEPLPAPVSASEKITLRAVPTPQTPRVASIAFETPTTLVESQSRRSRPLLPPAMESTPPPSDAPVVANVLAPASSRLQSKRGSRWTIFAAGAAGLILGLASVAATTRSTETTTQAPAAAAALSEPDAAPAASTAAKALAAPSASTASDSVKAAGERLGTPRPAAPSTKKSIF